MKSTRVLLALALLFAAAISFGQDHRLELGIEGGPSRVSLRGNAFTEDFYEADFAFSGGLSLQYNLTRHFALRTNLHFDRKGAAADVLFTDNTGATIADSRLRSGFDYVTVPLLMRLSFGDRFKFTANAGPFVGILMMETETADIPGDGPFEFDNTEAYEQVDFGLSAGVGVTRSVGAHFILSAELRNDLGLANVSAYPVVDDGTIKTNSTLLLVGVAYAFCAPKAATTTP